MSAGCLQWHDNEGHSGTIQPYILELLLSLWGRDLLKDMGFNLSNEYSTKVQSMMRGMGCHPNYGLGKFLQGRTEPVRAEPWKKKDGAWIFPRGHWGWNPHFLEDGRTSIGSSVASFSQKITSSTSISTRTIEGRTYKTISFPMEYPYFYY